MNIILTADIGSTFTKLTAVDVEAREIIGTARAFTTINTDVMDGFVEGMKELRAICGPLVFDKVLASSSAAGGLKMIAVGLVPDLTVQAARLASANAGAKILKTFAFELTNEELEEIVSLAPDMILLSGGTDGGNKDVIIHNAKLLSEAPLKCSIVVAGNKSAADPIRTIFKDYAGEVLFCANVMPEINLLNIEPAKRAIRDLFIKNIISAKGLSEFQATLSSEIVPTPLAAFDAANLLSLGYKKKPGLGDLLVFDVGGATTDVYSMSDGLPTRTNVFIQGLRQPYAKRTVEGDLGLRYSMPSLVEAIGLENLAAALDASEQECSQWLDLCQVDPGLVPELASFQKKMDDELAAGAVSIALARHCGKIEAVYTISGQAWAQTGKDLSKIAYVIGTGGPIINASDPLYILGRAVYQPSDMNLLKPQEPKLVLDKKYILSAMGLLSRLEPEAALDILLKEIV